MKTDGNILLIDSVGTQLWVARLGGGKVISRTCEIQKQHDKNINKLVAELIAGKTIDAFAVVVGPGSWTGCRVGVVAVKAYSCVFPDAKIISLGANENREELVAETLRKFCSGEFTDSKTLAPEYGGEFHVTVKKS